MTAMTYVFTNSWHLISWKHWLDERNILPFPILELRQAAGVEALSLEAIYLFHSIGTLTVLIRYFF